MVGGKKYNSTGSGFYWWLALLTIGFALYSLTVAATTAEKCGDAKREWVIIPPGWECQARRG